MSCAHRSVRSGEVEVAEHVRVEVFKEVTVSLETPRFSKGHILEKD
jgi:hypothetical protein